MARAIADVADRARTKRRTGHVQGGTFTINPVAGHALGTPIISQPQSAILGTYAVVKRPWVIQDEAGAT
jgi:2-oxoglutarate dehydrogenase E2 component (dihydrolipoamide succinyltransferase)